MRKNTLESNALRERKRETNNKTTWRKYNICRLETTVFCYECCFRLLHFFVRTSVTVDRYWKKEEKKINRYTAKKEPFFPSFLLISNLSPGRNKFQLMWLQVINGISVIIFIDSASQVLVGMTQTQKKKRQHQIFADDLRLVNFVWLLQLMMLCYPAQQPISTNEATKHCRPVWQEHVLKWLPISRNKLSHVDVLTKHRVGRECAGLCAHSTHRANEKCAASISAAQKRKNSTLAAGIQFQLFPLCLAHTLCARNEQSTQMNIVCYIRQPRSDHDKKKITLLCEEDGKK